MAGTTTETIVRLATFVVCAQALAAMIRSKRLQACQAIGIAPLLASLPVGAPPTPLASEHHTALGCPSMPFGTLKSITVLHTLVVIGQALATAPRRYLPKLLQPIAPAPAQRTLGTGTYGTPGGFHGFSPATLPVVPVPALKTVHRIGAEPVVLKACHTCFARARMQPLCTLRRHTPGCNHVFPPASHSGFALRCP